ncbi:hypothetical protein HMPREF0239_01321 [Clostridium sp. ATCC BAA-442]|nr:hypothetical protein HMPREF0239_01321 [Clostridium sp. ATCC BAA-442]
MGTGFHSPSQAERIGIACFRTVTRRVLIWMLDCLGGFDARPILLFLVHLAPPFQVF